MDKMNLEDDAKYNDEDSPRHRRLAPRRWSVERGITPDDGKPRRWLSKSERLTLERVEQAKKEGKEPDEKDKRIVRLLTGEPDDSATRLDQLRKRQDPSGKNVLEMKQLELPQQVEEQRKRAEGWKKLAAKAQEADRKIDADAKAILDVTKASQVQQNVALRLLDKHEQDKKGSRESRREALARERKAQEIATETLEKVDRNRKKRESTKGKDKDKDSSDKPKQMPAGLLMLRAKLKPIIVQKVMEADAMHKEESERAAAKKAAEEALRIEKAKKEQEEQEKRDKEQREREKQEREDREKELQEQEAKEREERRRAREQRHKEREEREAKERAERARQRQEREAADKKRKEQNRLDQRQKEQTESRSSYRDRPRRDDRDRDRQGRDRGRDRNEARRDAREPPRRDDDRDRSRRSDREPSRHDRDRDAKQHRPEQSPELKRLVALIDSETPDARGFRAQISEITTKFDATLVYVRNEQEQCEQALNVLNDLEWRLLNVLQRGSL